MARDRVNNEDGEPFASRVPLISSWWHICFASAYRASAALVALLHEGDRRRVACRYPVMPYEYLSVAPTSSAQESVSGGSDDR